MFALLLLAACPFQRADDPVINGDFEARATRVGAVGGGRPISIRDTPVPPASVGQDLLRRLKGVGHGRLVAPPH